MRFRKYHRCVRSLFFYSTTSISLRLSEFMFELGRLEIPVVNLSDDQIADELLDD